MAEEMLIEVAREAGIATTLVLNRPERKNALTGPSLPHSPLRSPISRHPKTRG